MVVLPRAAARQSMSRPGSGRSPRQHEHMRNPMTTRPRLRAMISFLISVLPPEPRGITDAAEAASLKPTCIADDRADASEDAFRRHARSVNVPPRLPSLGRMTALASRAGHLAQALLQEPLPRRWTHVQGVAARARSLAPVLGADADLLEAAAWLHDIGYAPGRDGPARLGRRPVPSRCPARRRHAVPTGRPSLLRHHRSRRTRTCRRLEPGVRSRHTRWPAF
jgi:hypothetical protein